MKISGVNFCSNKQTNFQSLKGKKSNTTIIKELKKELKSVKERLDALESKQEETVKPSRLHFRPAPGGSDIDENSAYMKSWHEYCKRCRKLGLKTPRPCAW